MSYRFPIARRTLRFAAQARRNWLVRHQVGVNFWLHIVGIPLAFVGLVLLFTSGWEWGVGAFLGGYFLQWVGHRLEGNDVGEFIPVKKLLGRPYIAIAPSQRCGGPLSSKATRKEPPLSEIS